ncbi:MAG: D-alanyl-D-alanine carboxypeptidase family protein [Actinomycetota bacterium]
MRAPRCATVGTCAARLAAARRGGRRAVLAALLVAALAVPAAAAGPSGVSAGSYIVVEPQSGTVLAQRGADRALPMASTTKMMTALVTVERASLDETAVVPREALVGGSSAGLAAGERRTVRDLLVGLLVPSGNDAAITLADHVGGSQARFVALMNRRAAELGLTRTHFVTPHGLDRPGHRASVRDLVTLARELMTHPEVRAIVARRTATIPAPGGGRRVLQNQNDLLAVDPEVDGVKTGHTDGAGYALVAHARRESLGVELYAAFIGSPSEAARVADGERLLTWGFSQFARPVLVRDGQVFGRARVRNRPGVTVGLAARGRIAAPILLSEPITERVVATPEVVPPIRRGQVVGRVTVRAGDRVLGTVPLVAERNVAGPGAVDRLRAAWDQVTP